MASLAESIGNFIGGKGKEQSKSAVSTQQPGTQQPGATNHKFDPETGQANPAYKPVAAVDANNPDNLANPFDVYAKLFKNEPGATGTKEAPKFALDSKIVGEAATASIDFSKSVTPEVMQKIQSGDSMALVELLNTVGRQTYQTALNHQASLTGNFMEHRLQHDRAGLDGSITTVLDKASLSKLAAKNPVLQDQITNVGKEFRKIMPDATPDQISEKVVAYFTDMAALVNPNAAATQGTGDGTGNKQDAGEVNWDKYLE